MLEWEALEVGPPDWNPLP
ncbi:hypothetical protein A2U01_0081230, partial [Trifolium medium]|nr:hypothetical protein [Trifolium medium]